MEEMGSKDKNWTRELSLDERRAYRERKGGKEGE